MRLDKFLAHSGFGSRKDVKKIIKDKLVKVNDEIVSKPNHHLNVEEDIIKVEDVVVDYEKDVYYMLNKPAGYISSHEADLYPSVLELIDNYRTDLILSGRLDVDTEGLLIITSDGKFSHQISHKNKDVLKKYYVELEKDFDHSCIKDLEAGIVLDEEQLKPAKVEVIDDKSILLSISEGKYHQVKRMMHYCQNEVLYLRREKINKLTLDESLEAGQYRELKEEDFKLLGV